MTRNVTIKLDESLLKLCRHSAVEDEKSLSQWISDNLKEIVDAPQKREKAKEHALSLLKKGYHLGGKPLNRELIYDK